MSETSREHRAAASRETVTCAVLTVSDSRTEETDESGRWIVEALLHTGHEVATRAIVRDEPGPIEAMLRGWIGDPAIRAVFTTGGTGIGRRDGTVEVATRLLGRRLDGFGELFRMLSWKEIGAAAMMSRAVAGVAAETLVFVLPGSVGAVRLAMKRLILPELRHLAWEITR